MVVDVAEVGAGVVGDQVEIGPHQAVADVDERGDASLDLEQVALEGVDPHGGVAADALVEDLVLEGFQAVLEPVHDREVLVHHEVHDGVEHEAGPFGEELRLRFAARAHVGVGQGGAVPDRDHVARADEEVGLAEGDPPLLPIRLRGPERDEERVAVALQLGPLVGEVGVLDGEVVQPELGLYLLEEGLVGLVETDPDEAIVLLQDLADVLQRDVPHAAAVCVGGARDDRAGLAVVRGHVSRVAFRGLTPERGVYSLPLIYHRTGGNILRNVGPGPAAGPSAIRTVDPARVCLGRRPLASPVLVCQGKPVG